MSPRRKNGPKDFPPTPGSGSVGRRTLALKCGHTTSGRPVTEGVKTLYFCPEGCGLQPTK